MRHNTNHGNNKQGFPMRTIDIINYDDTNDTTLIPCVLCEDFGIIVKVKQTKHKAFKPIYLELSSIYTSHDSRSIRLISKDSERLFLYTSYKNKNRMLRQVNTDTNHLFYYGGRVFLFGIAFSDIDFLGKISFVDDETRLLWKLMYGDKTTAHTREDLDPILQHLSRIF